ncbi:pleckstrin homology domain-containing family A member 1-like [Dendronephthya gigantea]|uniref:pleckstrin homology domain-containing family A member 1-like n=1 Tax=Dendronephthya gigantea TaxID=151771 RepID=UPI00106A7CE6|nr:pleckstrin homology domain-containing family A member 1-like [Dendronephthya gigantea]
MRDIRKTLSASIEHLHDLMFDRDETDSIPTGANYTGVIYREGYLFKQSRSMRKYWKTRYFVLRNDGLLYFRSILDKDGAPLGVIPLTRLSVHIDNIDTKSKPKYCLRMASRHFYFKTFCLCCFSNDERNNWLTALLTAISEDLVSSFTLSKYREERSLSVSSTDSGVSEGTASPSVSPVATMNNDTPRSMARTESCDIASLFHVTDGETQNRLSNRRPSRSLGSLAELRQLDSTDSPRTLPKKVKKSQGRFRKLKALSSFEFKGWRDSYIDLSCIGNS